ncbi:OmpA family protein [Sphingomonas crocodyli]|uniref:OmpA family protein n=1 Tax=Sphingomonas crocodyli TaxID=1979270 RepID=A0A437MA51_9SPHN|nr:OmpA family protein [Sphingomonas crocodyli]RVT94512.1 OmpA family protein [Sphingomonas crocodyli]
MRVIANRPSLYALLAIVALPVAGSLSAQQQDANDPNIIVNGVPTAEPVEMTKGPEIKGVISAREGDKMKVTTADGGSTIVAVNSATKIKGKRSSDSLLNGLPVKVKTMQGGGQLVASQITFETRDLKTATMIRNATEQRFVEQAAATEALRGRVGDIDKYNIKHTTNVHFDTGKSNLSEADKEQLCSTATQANATENALLLVIGYTDSTGSEDVNQALSEKRASRVINYLQQACGWKPYRMLTPTGMATADPLASNDTEEGKAQNRRVAVNVMVSKSVDNM